MRATEAGAVLRGVSLCWALERLRGIYRVKRRPKPGRQRQLGRFPLREISRVHGLFRLGPQAAADHLAGESGNDVLRLIAIRVVNNELRATVDRQKPPRRYEKASLLPRFPYHRIGRTLIEIDGSTGRGPDVDLSLANEEQA